MKRQPKPLVRGLAPALALSVILAAGCGGGGTSAEEEWAGSVCTDISNWKGQVQQSANTVREKLKSPQAGTLDAIDAEIQKAVSATRDLASNLKSLDPPNTDAGKQAKQQVDMLTSQLEATATQAEQTLDSVPKGASASEVVQDLAPLAPAIQSLAEQTSSALDSIKESGESIKEGFEQADSCKQLNS